MVALPANVSGFDTHCASISSRFDCRAVDVGLMTMAGERRHDECADLWGVVAVHHAFIDSSGPVGLLVGARVRYCVDTCAWIRRVFDAVSVAESTVQRS